MSGTTRCFGLNVGRLGLGGWLHTEPSLALGLRLHRRAADCLNLTVLLPCVELEIEGWWRGSLSSGI